MKLAIPSDNGRLHRHFGGAREFALVEIDREKKLTLSTTMVPAPEHKPGLFPLWLRELGVQTIIAGGIGRPALANFLRYGITVRAGAPDAPIESVVADYLSSKLLSAPEDCEHHETHHYHPDHGHKGCA